MLLDHLDKDNQQDDCADYEQCVVEVMQVAHAATFHSLCREMAWSRFHCSVSKRSARSRCSLEQLPSAWESRIAFAARLYSWVVMLRPFLSLDCVPASIGVVLAVFVLLTLQNPFTQL